VPHGGGYNTISNINVSKTMLDALRICQAFCKNKAMALCTITDVIVNVIAVHVYHSRNHMKQMQPPLSCHKTNQDTSAISIHH